MLHVILLSFGWPGLKILLSLHIKTPSRPELEQYKQRRLKWDDETDDDKESNYINFDIDNYSVASSIPSDEEEEPLNNLNNVLDVLDAVNT